MLIVAVVISVLALGVSVYSMAQNSVSLSPSAASPSYTCYGSGGLAFQCNSGQYCSKGLCTNSKPAGSAICFNQNRTVSSCASSQICYNGECVDSVAATEFYTKGEVDGIIKGISTKTLNQINNATIVTFLDPMVTDCNAVCNARSKICTLSILEYAYRPVVNGSGNIASNIIRDKSIISCSQSFQTGILGNMTKSLSCVCS